MPIRIAWFAVKALGEDRRGLPVSYVVIDNSTGAVVRLVSRILNPGACLEAHAIRDCLNAQIDYIAGTLPTCL